ncbi:MAG TPA: protein kinase [Polyangiaceae bacterium]|nr:protein kinase [Polyangiaceae bacterium]
MKSPDDATLGRTATFGSLAESGPVAKRSQAVVGEAPPPEPNTPPRFVIREALGHGGMGVVYRAFDSELGLDVALKALNDLGSESRSWLKAEFRSLAGIVHPNLVQLHELVVDDQRCFFTMELVRGPDLVEYFSAHAERKEQGARDQWERVTREAARQLAHALASLHRAGKLHRDVKPSNVLVTDSGRVVLLDFGLVEPIPTGFDTTQGRRMIAGTLPYMSPEQAWAQRLTAASDWYAFGVTLFEALTGRLPIDGEAARIFAAKREQPGARPSRFIADIPEDLDSLVARLLDPEPGNRPDEQEILATLGGHSVQGIVSLPPSKLDRASAPFLGRDAELRDLNEAWAAVRAGATLVVSVSGASGIGKSELIRRFLETPAVAQSSLVLSGRCHPQESLAFNALDGVIDDLATSLARLSPQELDAVRPPDLDALLRLFPTLARVPTFVPLASAPTGERATPEVRRVAFASLKSLFTRLTAFKTPLLWLDDLQWADVGSAALLRELLRGPDRPPLLVVLCLREEDRRQNRVLEALVDSLSAEDGSSLKQLELAPLESAESLALIRELLPPELRAEERLESLYLEAGGSPFFLCELGRYFKSVASGADHSVLRVDAMLQHRTSQLPADALRVLELVSVAGEPLEQRVLLRAAGLEPAQLPLLRTLEQLSFVRTSPGEERLAEVYHHRVRDHLLEGLTDEVRRSHHASLASALLLASKPNLQSVVEHSERADDLAAVRRYIVPAARQAADAFAFARAAALYRRALDLGVTDMDQPELHTQLGNALANAGHGREAGEAYELAASLLEQGVRSDVSRLLYLRRRAAEQFLQSGHDQQAVNALREVLSAHGIPFPESRGQALSWALGLRLKSLLKKLDVPTRGELEVPQALNERFDAVWAVSMRLTMVNHTRTSYFAARCLMSALEAREPSRMVLGLSLEAPNVAMVPATFFQRRADRMLDIAQGLADGTGKPYDRAIVLSGRGATEWLRGRWQSALELMDQASDLIRRSSQGVSWEHALFEMWSLAALAQLGRFKELRERAQQTMRDAEQRDDRYLTRNCCLGQATLAWLAEDRADWAMKMAERAIAWSPEEYTTQHYHHYLTSAQALLYKGDVAAAYERSVREWPRLKENLFLGAPCVRDELLHLRGRTALAAAAAASGNTARELLGVVRKDAKALASHGLDCASAWAQLLHAGADRLERKHESALEQLAGARSDFGKANMRAYEQAAAYCHGELLAGAGQQLRQEALDYFAGEGVVQPLRFIAMLAPGLLVPQSA